MNHSKILPFIFSGLVISLGVGAIVTHAQGYTPLTPIQGTVAEKDILDASGKVVVAAGKTDMMTYLSGAIKLLIAVGGAIAILMAIIGGTQYVAAGISPDAKSNAKDNIQKAFIGLALILSSYLILNSINPNLVKVNFKLDQIKTSNLIPVEIKSGTDAMKGMSTAAEDVARAQLQGVRVNNDFPCIDSAGAAITYEIYSNTHNGLGCTTIAGLGSRAISGVNDLVILSGGYTPTITGGYELGHQTHGPGYENNLDLNKGTPQIDAAIMANGPLSQLAADATHCGVAIDPHYQPYGTPRGGTYVDEPNRANGAVTGTGTHWHVCY